MIKSKGVRRCRLLPHHNLGCGKYALLGRTDPMLQRLQRLHEGNNNNNGNGSGSGNKGQSQERVTKGQLAQYMEMMEGLGIECWVE